MRDLLLEHEGHAVETLNLFKPAQQKPRTDVIGKVRHDPDPDTTQGRDVEGERVALDDLEPVGIPRRKLAECGHATAVLFDRDDAGRAGCEQRPGQSARPGPHLKYDG